MTRIMSIDYGKKRCGIAVTDPLRIIVTGLDTVETSRIYEEVESYIAREPVETVVFGNPVHADGTETYLKKDVDKLAQMLSEKLGLKIEYEDEAFTSADARSIIYHSGMKKKKRRDKSLIDKVSAVLILQRYLGHI